MRAVMGADRGGSMGGGIRAVLVCGTAIAALMAPQGDAAEASSRGKPRSTTEIVKQTIEQKPGNVQLVTFPDTKWSSVKVVRGRPAAKDGDPRTLPPEKTENAEIVTFGDLQSKPVRVVRGEAKLAVVAPRPANGRGTQTTQT